MAPSKIPYMSAGRNPREKKEKLHDVNEIFVRGQTRIRTAAGKFRPWVRCTFVFSVVVFVSSVWFGLSALRLVSLELDTKISFINNRIRRLSEEKLDLEVRAASLVSPARVWKGGEEAGMKKTPGESIRIVNVAE